MIVAMCSGEGRTFEAVTRILGAQMTAVVCDKPEAGALLRAKTLGIPAHCLPRTSYPSRTEHESAVLDALKSCGSIAILALLGYMRVLSATFLDLLKKQHPHIEIINLHPAPLSQYKGAHGLQHALDVRAPCWGVSVHRVTPELDSGPLLSYRSLDVLPTDRFETLRERAHPLEVSAVLEAIDILTRRNPLS